MEIELIIAIGVYILITIRVYTSIVLIRRSKKKENKRIIHIDGCY